MNQNIELLKCVFFF